MTAGGMQPADLGELVEVSGPRVSPDGRTVACVVTSIDLAANTYISRIWIVAADGSGAPQPVTPDGGRSSLPRWSPDGTLLAYVHRGDDSGDAGSADGAGSGDGGDDAGGSTLCCVDIAGAQEPRVVATWPEAIENLAWAPDGSAIAFTARVEDRDRAGKKAKDQPPRRITTLFSRHDDVGWTAGRPRHLFVVEADGRTPPAAVTEGPVDDQGVTWSPDSRRLAFTSARHPDWDLTRTNDVFVVDRSGGEPRRLTSTDKTYHSPSWSPDGRAVAVHVCDERTTPRHGQIGIVDAAGGTAVRILTTELDRQCDPHGATRDPVWQGGDLWFTVEDAGAVHLYRTGTGEPRPVVTGERSISGYDVAGGTVAFTASTPTCPAELYVVDGEGGERRLTHFTTAFTGGRTLVAPERFTARSADGTEVEAWVMRPAGFEEGQHYPALLNIHGGPFTQYGYNFFDEFQFEAGAGYAVVYCNPRGSSGYSEAWGRAIRWPECEQDPGSGWGGVDYDDVMAVADEAVARFPFIDGDRMGVIGGSYGGFMTSWIISHTDRFRSACSERAVNDIAHLEHDSDIASTFEDYVGVSFVDDLEPYRRQSPITYVKNITTPVLLVHSEQDLRCPISQADELFVALRLLGRQVEMVRFPGEGHELSRSGSPLHRRQRAEIILEWFGRTL